MMNCSTLHLIMTQRQSILIIECIILMTHYLLFLTILFIILTSKNLCRVMSWCTFFLR